STHCKGAVRVREFLRPNGHPHTMLDLDRDPSAQEFLDRIHVTPAEIPVVITCSKVVLKNPSNKEIADALGFNAAIDQTQVRDLVIVGAGPAGRRCMGRRKDWMSWSWSRLPLGARPAQAPGSRTTSAFRRGSKALSWRRAPPTRR